MSQHPYVERRRTRRAPLERALVIETPEGALTCTLRDLSVAGLAFYADRPFHLDALFALDVEADPGPDFPSLRIRATSAVVRCDPCGEDRYEIALFFLEIDRESKRAIADYVAAMEARSRPLLDQ
jgi:PilZ domain